MNLFQLVLDWISGIQPQATIKIQALTESHRVQTWSKDWSFPKIWACVQSVRSDLVSSDVQRNSELLCFPLLFLFTFLIEYKSISTFCPYLKLVPSLTLVESKDVSICGKLKPTGKIFSIAHHVLFKKQNFWMETFLAVAKQWQAINIYLEVASKRQGGSSVTMYLSQINIASVSSYYFSLSLKWMLVRGNNERLVSKGIQLQLLKGTKSNKWLVVWDSNSVLRWILFFI